MRISFATKIHFAQIRFYVEKSSKNPGNKFSEFEFLSVCFKNAYETFFVHFKTPCFNNNCENISSWQEKGGECKL